MQKLLVTALLGMMFVGAGCKSDGMKDDDMKMKDTKKMSMKDDCAMCPGQQTANADGTCPKCGMKVK